LAGRLAKAGARDVFYVISLDVLPDLAACPLIVPVPTGVDAAAIETALVPAGAAARGRKPVSRLGNLFVYATPDTLDRFQKFSAVARPELAAALASVDGTTAQLLLLPSTQTRRVIEEVIPNLPQEIGGTATRIFTQGIQWAVIGCAVAPKKLDVRIVVQSASADAATTLNTELAKLLRSLGDLPSVQQVLPKFSELAKQFSPTVAGDRITLQMNSVTALAALLAPPVSAAQTQSARAQSTNNLKQIMLGMFNWLDGQKRQSFPPRVLYSQNGKPLLSWRVQILPYLDAQKLYDEFHLDEPWDSEHNRKLIERMPDVYRSPLTAVAAGHTTYVVPVVDKGVFAGRETLQFKEITDGTSNTIAVVEADADHAVIWTKPDDIEINLAEPLKGLVNNTLHGFLAAFVDGSVRLLKDTTDKENLGRLFMATDGQAIGRLP
ncbi:MAG: DUF1559 domain-containing protein, partial [Singulisphaera sp.]